MPVLALGAILIVLIICHRPILIKIGSLPALADELEPSDLIVVMSGGLPDIHYGVDLYHAGYAPKLLFLGHFPVELAVLSEKPFEVVERSWDEIAAHLALNSNVSPEDILYAEAFNSSTYERVKNAMRIAQDHNVQSVILVGDLIHSRRVKFSAGKILDGSPIKVISAPTPQSYLPEPYRFDAENWWTDESELTSVVGEYIRLVYYWGKYGL